MDLSTHKIFPKEICSKEYLSNFIITNPSYTDALKMGFSTYGISPTLKMYTEKNGMVYIPRESTLLPNGVKETDLQDKRVLGVDVNFKSRIVLKDYQKSPVQSLVSNTCGILEADCGTGKTVMGLEVSALIGKTVLVLVHKGFLLEQWRARISEFLGEEAGHVQGDTWDWRGKKIVIAMLQTLFSQKDNIPEDFVNYFGVVISDECHRVSAPTWSQVISLFPAKRRYGLTATSKRSDGLEIIFHAHLGKTLFSLRGQSLEPDITMFYTGEPVYTREFVNARTNNGSMAKLTSTLCKRNARNSLILSLLSEASKMGRKILLLTDRVEHAKTLKSLFDTAERGRDYETALYLGETSKQDRALAEQADVIFATSQIAKEGLDIPALDTLFLVSPIASQVILQQSIGRILRYCEGKKSPKVVDLVDHNDMCFAMARKRMGIYELLGYKYTINKGGYKRD